MRPRGTLSLLLAWCAVGARAPLALRSNFGNGGEFPIDHRGDEDNVSPPISWTGAPKNTKSFVLLFESEPTSSDGARKRATHWVVYDIPHEVSELREELSGAGASEVSRLGMKDDAGTAPVVVDPMGDMFGDGYVDPEIQAMRNMIDGAMDASFEEKNRANEGTNSHGTHYYHGPSKRGTTCTFKLYALSARLELPRSSARDAIVAAMKGKVLDKATLSAVLS